MTGRCSNMAKAKAKMGRPTKYDPAYCDAVVEHMSEGASLLSFAASIDVARSTINEWADVHPEFSEAVSRGKAKCAAWWETAGRNLALKGEGNATMVVFGLKNMGADEWRDKQEVEHSGGVKVERVQITFVEGDDENG